jgi:hypothetical protein
LFVFAIVLIGNNAMGHGFIVKKSIIPLDVSVQNSSAGGIIAADVNDDGAYDLLVTASGHVGAYATDGKRLWSRRIDVRVSGQSESQGLPGHHGPGVQAGDINGDRVKRLERQ